MRRWAILVVVLFMSTGVVPTAGNADPRSSPDGKGPTARTIAAEGPDFNGDGFADLAVGGGRRPPPRNDEVDLVHVVYGSPTGLSERTSQTWAEDDLGIDSGHSFGYALASGDFDGDSYSDLAVANSSLTVGEAESAGVVWILYGSVEGLVKERAQRWSQNSPGIKGAAEKDDTFGVALTAADFGHGPEDDLAVGVRYENNRAGAVNVIYGSANGLSAAGNQIWTQNTPGIPGRAECCDRFGSSLTSGNLAGDGRADLVVGVLDDVVKGEIGGSVQVILGSSRGLTATGNQLWSQNSPGIVGTAEDEDSFGQSLALGHFAGTPYLDLAVGAPGENDYSGVVHVIRGTANGLRATDSQLWRQSTKGVPGSPEYADVFGVSLAAGELGSDRAHDDLAIGVPGESVGRNRNAGAIQILHGTDTGLASADSRFLSQATPGVLGAPGREDQFGWYLQVADFGRDPQGAADLATGAAGESSVNVLYGGTTGLTTIRSQRWTQLGYVLGGS